ncbi:MAG: sensor histidine kinase [Bacteroidia bacterium]
MKLIGKTILYYLLISLPLLLIAGYVSYILIRSEVRDGTDESLLKEKAQIEKQIDAAGGLCNTTDPLSSVTPVASAQSGDVITDTTLLDTAEHEDVHYRMLTGYHKAKGANYRIVIFKPRLEEDELLEGLFSSFLVVIGFLIAAFFVVNWLLSNTLWKPFYRTIETLDAYEIKDQDQAVFGTSSTKEFNQLNRSLDRMTEKIRGDFRRQKEFTENASHEMQTPLAVIKSKLELLLQSPNLGERELNQLLGIEGSVNKLAALNKALLLLAKIGNRQFKETEAVHVEQVVDRLLANYEDFILAKRLSVNKTMNSGLTLEANAALCEILIANLLQNAIRHNYPEGTITVELNASSLRVSNTGEPLSLRPDELFERFKKNDASKESLGLGLAIVKSICDYYGYSVQYSYANNLHTFVIYLQNQ